jgi:molybdopterin synthase catalytic subunit
MKTAGGGLPCIVPLGGAEIGTAELQPDIAMTAIRRDEMNTSFVVAATITEAPLSAETALAAVQSTSCGAAVSFSGVVRNHDGGREVDALSYTAHPGAQRVIEEVLAEIAAKNNGVRLWAAHRVGPLVIGDAALVASAAAAHRAQAFAACSELVDAIKERVPIWKEQFFSDGRVEWVGAGE